MDNSSFELTAKEIQRIEEWKGTLPPIEEDVFGTEYQYTYSFYPTGLGIIKTVRRVDGAELDLTNYNNW